MADSFKNIDPKVITRGLMDSLHQSIVDPRCDECGTMLPSGGLTPLLCPTCSDISQRIFRQQYQDYLSQEKPRRRVHVVKLPKDFKW